MQNTENAKDKKRNFRDKIPINIRTLKDKKLKFVLRKSEKSFKNSLLALEKNKLLLQEEESYLKEDNFLEKTWKLSQKDLKKDLDLNSRTKIWNLDLDLGPYRLDYSANSSSLCLAGQKGHLAVMEWKTGKLLSEIYLKEKIQDVKFINSGLIAVGQQKYTYIYDNQGVEIHQIKDFVDVSRLEFLKWHFLLVGSGNTPFIKWQDTSTGKIVAEYNSKLGSTRSMAQNPWNAVIHLGHNNGNVSMWSPSMSSPLVKMLCHSGPVQDVKVDLSGNYMATVGLDSQLKIWDIRTFKLLQHYYMETPASFLDISQKGILAVGHGPHVSFYKNIFKEKQNQPYMKHLQPSSRVSDLAFCPWEDVLGLGHSKGVSSLIIPGSGEPNFDTMTANPYQTTKQRQESEVHALLDKLAPEMITLDPNIIGNIDDAPSHVIKQERKVQAQEKVEQEKKKKKGKSSALRRYLKKQPNVRDAKRCAKGSKCPFIHDDSGICLYYQTGNCRFGSKCALKHVKLNKIKSRSNASSSTLKPLVVRDKEVVSREISNQLKYSDITKTNADSDIVRTDPVSNQTPNEPPKPLHSHEITSPEPFVPLPDRTPLCPFKDYCRYGNKCKYSHGLECHICGGKVLHPQASVEEYQEHFATCSSLAEKIKTLTDYDMECVVCMELVKNKKDPRFGLLSCEHCVCLECIRQWRSKESVSTSKSCPICRSVTYFITPSTVWPDDEITKAFIITNYQSKLSKINCKYFNYGDGSCPFGTSCLYKHVTRDGSVANANLRYVSGGDESRILASYHLSDYL